MASFNIIDNEHASAIRNLTETIKYFERDTYNNRLHKNTIRNQNTSYPVNNFVTLLGSLLNTFQDQLIKAEAMHEMSQIVSKNKIRDPRNPGADITYGPIVCNDMTIEELKEAMSVSNIIQTSNVSSPSEPKPKSPVKDTAETSTKKEVNTKQTPFNLNDEYASVIKNLTESIDTNMQIRHTTIDNIGNISYPVDNFLRLLGSLLNMFQDEFLKVESMNIVYLIASKAKLEDLRKEDAKYE